jgi:carbon monoxide dehydrogenase subunit G
MTRLRRAAALLALALGAAPAIAGAVEVKVTRGPGKGYSITGSFTVQASSSAVWAVLTDYDRIGDFVKEMRRSKLVTSRADGLKIIEQETVGSALIFSRVVRVVLEIRREPGRLLFKDVGREDFRDYSGSWSVASVPPGTEVVYHLDALPDFKIPSFMMRSGMKRGARKLLDQVRAEIERRK